MSSWATISRKRVGELAVYPWPARREISDTLSRNAVSNTKETIRSVSLLPRAFFPPPRCIGRGRALQRSEPPRFKSGGTERARDKRAWRWEGIEGEQRRKDPGVAVFPIGRATDCWNKIENRGGRKHNRCRSEREGKKEGRKEGRKESVHPLTREGNEFTAGDNSLVPNWSKPLFWVVIKTPPRHRIWSAESFL